jgi:NAD(P)-dependent dehydrogenase (short-subunit alcohol dehydrogenase family)
MTPRTIVLTGAAGALGAALARRFAGDPDVNLVVADIDARGLDDLVAALPATVAAIPTDVSDQAAVDALIDEAVARCGRLDVMINNAGMLSPNARMHNLTADDWERAWRVNLMGARHPLGWASPDDLVGAFAYLAGDDARWTTGSAVVVDGGYTAL